MTTSQAAPAAPAAFPDLIEHLMPFGSISTLSGASGVGKTAFLTSMILAIQRGEPLFGFATHVPTAIGMLVCDRPWRDHQAWLDKAGCAPFSYLSLWDQDYQWEVLRDYKSLPKIFGSLVDALGLPAGAWLIVEPITLFIPGRLHDYRDMAIGLGLLGQQLRARQLTTLGVFHIGKQKGKHEQYGRPQDRILGSAALIGYTETAFYLLSPEEAERRTYEFGIIPHQIQSSTLQYVRDASGLFVPAEYFDDVQEEEVALSVLPLDGTLMTSAVWCLGIQRLLHVSVSSAERLMRRLRAGGRVVRVGQGKYRRAVPQ